MNLAQRELTYSMPSKSSIILQRDISAPPFDHKLHYHSVVEKFNFLEKYTHGDISHAAHQLSWLYEDPRLMHGAAIEHLSG